MSASSLWPSAGHALLARDTDGRLVPTAAYARHLFGRPEVALVPESCRAEHALHRALATDPLRPVSQADLLALRDPDARENLGHVIALRDALFAAGTLEAWYLQRFRAATESAGGTGNGRDATDGARGAEPRSDATQGPRGATEIRAGSALAVPPILVDAVAQAIVQQVLGDEGDALAWRAAELWFRPQRIALEQGRVLAGDRETLARQQETAGLGDIGRLLVEAGAPLQRADLRVLGAAEAPRYFAEAAQPAFTSRLLLDLTHELTLDVGHGLNFKLKARSGLQPLAMLIARWVRHLLGVEVRVTPLQRIDDGQWRWHVGLDAESSSLLNDLYEGSEVEPARLQRLLSLFRLDFADPAEMRRDVAGKPVYLGLMTDATGVLRMKPQNLLLNLPLAAQVA